MSPDGKPEMQARLPTFWRIVSALSLALALLLIAAAIGVTLYVELSYREQKTQESVVDARILASTVAAALYFDDQRAAAEYLGALRANPEILAAGIYDVRGNLFSGFERSAAEPLPAHQQATEPRFEGNRLLVTAPIEQDGIAIGLIHLTVVAEPYSVRLLRFGGVLLLAVMAALMLLVLRSAQRALAAANLELAARAQELSNTNAELREQMQEREKAEATLRQVQKMETIGQLTGGVAHDFNNLLTIILGNLGRLERRLAEGADRSVVEKLIRNATSGAQRATTLTRSLLAFARRQPLDPKPINVNRLISGMHEILMRALGERVVVRTVGLGGLWQTMIDPNQLENAVLNLAVNARDAMPQGGRLTIETANVSLPGDEPTPEGLPPGDYVVITVSDTGAGMSREVLANAFEPFFTTKDIGHGTGLGLSQVYGFVRQSGGQVTMDSEVGAGTTVRIFLPRLEAPQAEPPPLPQPAAEPPLPRGRGEWVLVVEDEPTVREQSVGLLEELGYQVLEAQDAAEALDVLAREAKIALLFTDIGLPGGMDGRQLADRALQLRPELKALYTTGYARDAITRDGRLDSGVRVLSKPFDIGQLARAARETLETQGDAAAVPTVLVVEDEILIRLDLADSLVEAGFQVLEASTAAEAIEHFRSAPDPIEAAILDLGLPDMRGDALALEIRQRHPDVPIVILSGSVNPELQKSFAGTKRIRFVSKPYQLSHLLRTLASIGVAGRGA